MITYTSARIYMPRRSNFLQQQASKTETPRWLFCISKSFWSNSKSRCTALAQQVQQLQLQRKSYIASISSAGRREGSTLLAFTGDPEQIAGSIQRYEVLCAWSSDVDKCVEETAVTWKTTKIMQRTGESVPKWKSKYFYKWDLQSPDFYRHNWTRSTGGLTLHFVQFRFLPWTCTP